MIHHFIIINMANDWWGGAQGAEKEDYESSKQTKPSL